MLFHILIYLIYMMKIDGRTLCVSLLLTLAACQSWPASSRSGGVRTIEIGNQLSTVFIHVTAGDEIRWTNWRTTPVRITLLDYVLNKLSCRSNFHGHFYSGAETVLLPSASAGLCFRTPGMISYVVRMPSEFLDEDIAESGKIQVRTF